MTIRNSIARACLAVSVLLPLAAAAQQFTNPRPLQRATDEHQALLFARAYDKLDKAADEARSKGLRTSDGQMLLTAIYQGAAGCSCGNQLTEELWKVRKANLEEWSKRNPASVTARLSLAIYPLRYAWFARGGGYANTVNENASRLFRERVEEARRALSALDAQAKSDPGWYDAMLDVATSQGWPRERFDTLFEEGVRKHPGHLSLYFSATTYHAGKWYGSDAEMRLVIDALTERTRPAMGETLYARLHWANQNDDMFTNGQTDWKRMKGGFERILADYPDPWNLNNFARFACQAGDWSTVKRLTAAIGDKPIALAWFNDLQFFANCRTQAARGSP